MRTVVETPSYLRVAGRLFSEAIVAMVSAYPECGDLIQGTGGFRKVRVGRGDMGKRGGARVVYILRSDNFPIFLIAVYPKNLKEKPQESRTQ